MAKQKRPPIRFIDAGTVSYLRSQSIYHGLAHARNASTPDTIVMLTPREPYVSIGLHQGRDDVDAEYCQREGLPVVRREVGGGTVLLDENQLFVQWILSPDRLPCRPEPRFARFTEPLVGTLRDLGIPALFRPVNDVHVHGRKICGTGAGRIQEAEVLVGNFLLDFDRARMARLLRVPSPEFRKKVSEGLRLYLTTIREELGTLPDRARLKALYLQNTCKTLETALVPGKLTAAEQQSISKLEGKLSSSSFRDREGPSVGAGVKIHQDVYVSQSEHRVAGGQITVTARHRERHLENVSIQWADGLSPGRSLRPLESRLEGAALRRASLVEALTDQGGSPELIVPGITADDWVDAVLGLIPERERRDHA